MACVFALVGVVGFEDAFGSFDEDDAEFGGVDAAEVGLEGAVDEVGECACEFDAGGSAADDGDGHEACAFAFIGGEFGAF